MLSREVIRRIRQLQLRARRAVHGLLGGRYHSVFKGLGIAFEEVRAYQPGDDIRSIDWNVTARMGHPYVKRYIEERELTVMLAVDVSASGRFGSGRLQKHEVVAELASLLAFSAIANNDKVGLLAFTDRIERFVPPRKGAKHVLRLIRDVLFVEAAHAGTSISGALDYLNRVLRRRAIIFLFSDFLDQGYERVLKLTGRRHDLIAVRVVDPREEMLPSAGLVALQDAETGARRLLDTNDWQLREAYAQQAVRRREAFEQAMRSAGVDCLEVTTAGGYLERLLRFFQARARRK